MQYESRIGDGGRTLLIRTALKMLNRVHPEDLSIREVARLAELSSGAPYHHFKNKTDLLSACAVVAWTDLCIQLEDDDVDGAREQLLQRAQKYLAYARKNPGPYRLITSRLFEDQKKFSEIAELRARAMGGVISLILYARHPEIDRQTAKLLGVSMWSMLHGHLVLDIEYSSLIGPRAHLDQAIAEIATNVAFLPLTPTIKPAVSDS